MSIKSRLCKQLASYFIQGLACIFVLIVFYTPVGNFLLVRMPFYQVTPTGCPQITTSTPFPAPTQAFYQETQGFTGKCCARLSILQ